MSAEMLRYPESLAPDTAFALNSLPALFWSLDPNYHDEPDVVICQICLRAVGDGEKCNCFEHLFRLPEPDAEIERGQQ